ncbi:hypothetical protein [Tychonema sp. BBK16]|uniref:hypothetical protein n=2 Tax=Tychonema sp. BBK16 TaxID=2699888 RepID=UPI0038D2EDC5
MQIFVGAKHFGSKYLVLTNKLSAEMLRPCTHRDAPANTAKSVRSDARTCLGVPDDDFADLIITSPPYANNYDYADATRLEMCFVGEISGKTGSITSLCAKAVCGLGDD